MVDHNVKEITMQETNDHLMKTDIEQNTAPNSKKENQRSMVTYRNDVSHTASYIKSENGNSQTSFHLDKSDTVKHKPKINKAEMSSYIDGSIADEDFGPDSSSDSDEWQIDKKQTSIPRDKLEHI